MGPILKNFFIIFALFVITIVTAKAEEMIIENDQNEVNVDQDYNNNAENELYDPDYVNRSPAIVLEEENKNIETKVPNLDYSEEENFANQQYFNDDATNGGYQDDYAHESENDDSSNDP